MAGTISDTRMMTWLRQQVRLLEAWREELASRPDVNMADIVRVERHYHWLCQEVYALEPKSHTLA